jgi:hypothetical protein
MFKTTFETDGIGGMLLQRQRALTTDRANGLLIKFDFRLKM